MPESRIAHYEITGKIGAGAMGEVYRARDTKLNREVAIKVLPDSFASNAESLGRFEREAQLLAALNHPHIATIFGIEEIEDTRAIVLELVEGETLQERLRHGPLSLEEVLPVFRQIAGALEAAHEKGIVHRDLKPGNIKFTAEGEAKVLDFGLAKAIEGAREETTEIDPEAPTLPVETTTPGMVLGTPAYMSPEQTRGQPVDKRTDVWAFGCCLYEALTGRKPFKAQTVSDMMAEVLKSDPDYTIVPVETPAEILSLLRRCLEKEPRRRLRDIGDIAIRLEETTETSRLSPAVPTETSPSAGGFKPLKAVAVLGAIALAVGLGFFLGRTPSPETSPVTAAPAIRSIAILPFENRKEDDNDWLAKDMAEVLRQKLGTIGGLVAKLDDISQESYRDAGKSFSEVASDLKVDALVIGNLVEHEGNYIVNVSMIRAQDGQDIPLGRFEQEAEKYSALEIEVATAIAEKIRSDLTPEERRRIIVSESVDLAAYRAYLTGLEHYDRKEFEIAETFFEEARRLDSTFADPIILTADMIKRRYLERFASLTPSEARAEARPEYQRAAEIDPDYPRLLGHLASLEWEEGDFVKSDATLRAAEEADPDNPVLMLFRSIFLFGIEGRYEEAIEEIEAALELYPQRLTFLQHRVLYEELSGNYEAALRRMEELKARFGAHGMEASEARCLLALKRFDELETLSQAVLAKDPDNLEVLGCRVRAQLAQGNSDAALPEIEERGEIRDEYVHCAYQAELGNWEAAFKSLSRPVDDKDTDLVYFLRSHDMLTLFGDDRRYWDLVEDIGFPALPIGHPYREKEQELRYGKSRADPIRSLAIVPFENRTDDPEFEDFTTIVRKELHARLASFEELDVRAVSQTKAAILGYDATLSGSLTHQDGELTVDLVLTGKDGGKRLLAPVAQPSEKLLTLQADVTLAVARQCAVTLDGTSIARLRSGDTANERAWSFYQRGLVEMDKVTKESSEKAEEWFLKAIEAADKGYLNPQISLAYLHWLPVIWGGGTTPPIEAYAEAIKVLDQADRFLKPEERERLELERAYFEMLANFDWEGLAVVLDRELRKPRDEIAPHVLWIRCWYLLFVTGHYTDALRDIQEARQREPGRVGHLDALAEVYTFMEEEAKAAKINEAMQGEQVDDMDRLLNLALNFKNLAKQEEDTGKAQQYLERALGSTKEARERFDDHPGALAVHAEVLAATAGKEVEARALLSRVEGIRSDSEKKVFVPAVWIARGYAELGESDDLEKAMDLLEAAHKHREGNSFLYNLRKPDLMRMLHKEQRYWDLIDRMNYQPLPPAHPFHKTEAKMRSWKKRGD